MPLLLCYYYAALHNRPTYTWQTNRSTEGATLYRDIK